VGDVVGRLPFLTRLLPLSRPVCLKKLEDVRQVCEQLLLGLARRQGNTSQLSYTRPQCTTDGLPNRLLSTLMRREHVLKDSMREVANDGTLPHVVALDYLLQHSLAFTREHVAKARGGYEHVRMHYHQPS
jgi:hypothetical protein